MAAGLSRLRLKNFTRALFKLLLLDSLEEDGLAPNSLQEIFSVRETKVIFIASSAVKYCVNLVHCSRAMGGGIGHEGYLISFTAYETTSEGGIKFSLRASVVAR